LQGRDAIDAVASEMGLLLGWSVWERQKQIDKYHDFLELCQRFRTEDLEVREADKNPTFRISSN
jgi:hypothetical protein